MTGQHRSETAVSRDAKRRPRHGQGSLYRCDDGHWEGSIVVGRTADGRPRRRKVKAATRAAAAARLDQLRAELGAGANHRDGNLTVAAWLDRWLATLPGTVSVGTERNYADVVDRYVKPRLGHLRLVNLAPDDVQRMVDDLRAQYSANTTRLARSVLRRALRVAEARELVARNVAALVDGPKVAGTVEGRTMSPDQAARLLDVAAGDRLGAAVVVALVTGLRPGELLGLRWVDVDLGAGVLTVSGALKRRAGGARWDPLPKTRQSRRRIGVPASVVDTLSQHRRAQAAERLLLGAEWGANGWAEIGLVFTTALGTALDDANYRHHLARLCRRAGIGEWHPHELRHSAASLALAAGADLKVVSELLGHTSIRITADTYGHLLDGATGRVTAAVADLLAASSPALAGAPTTPKRGRRRAT